MCCERKKKVDKDIRKIRKKKKKKNLVEIWFKNSYCSFDDFIKFIDSFFLSLFKFNDDNHLFEMGTNKLSLNTLLTKQNKKKRGIAFSSPRKKFFFYCKVYVYLSCR